MGRLINPKLVLSCACVALCVIAVLLSLKLGHSREAALRGYDVEGTFAYCDGASADNKVSGPFASRIISLWPNLDYADCGMWEASGVTIGGASSGVYRKTEDPNVYMLFDEGDLRIGCVHVAYSSGETAEAYLFESGGVHRITRISRSAVTVE